MPRTASNSFELGRLPTPARGSASEDQQPPWPASPWPPRGVPLTITTAAPAPAPPPAPAHTCRAATSPRVPAGGPATVAAATLLTRLPSAVAAPPRPRHGTPSGPAGTAATAQEEALRVRSNVLRGMWYSLSRLWRPRLVFFLLRAAFSLLQIAASIAVMALPSSLGDSPSGGDLDGDAPLAGSQCDPEPIFIYLALHACRLAALLPLDVYLTLSPHGNARQRRPGARNFHERERNRAFGTLDRDRKVAKIVDLLSLAYCVLFAVGNWAVWSRTECARRPAESLPLFYTGLSMLCVTYLYILIILIITTMVVFFLPLFLVILRVLGIARRFPQPDIRPETGKVEKDEVEKVTRLVYYVDEDEWSNLVKSSRRESSSFQQLRTSDAWTSEMTNIAWTGPQVASGIALPLSPGHPSDTEEKELVFLIAARPSATISGTSLEDGQDGGSGGDHTMKKTSTLSSSTDPPPQDRTAGPPPRRAMVSPMLLFGRRRRWTGPLHSGPLFVSEAKTDKKQTDDSDEVEKAAATAVPDQPRILRYPLHPLPSHRSTCPICLCDFESPLQRQSSDLSASLPSLRQERDGDDGAGAGAGAEGGAPEPMRLLPCQHVLHVSCIDEWLTTVSGRCPICQRPVLKASDEDEQTVGGAIEAAGGDGGGEAGRGEN